MPPEVRASMAEGSATPLVDALRAQPFRDRNAEINAAAAEMRTDEALERPLLWLERR
jgi:hypothetical protein